MDRPTDERGQARCMLILTLCIDNRSPENYELFNFAHSYNRIPCVLITVKQIALSLINFPDNAYPYLFILIVLASDVEIINSLRIALPLSLSLSFWMVKNYHERMLCKMQS